MAQGQGNQLAHGYPGTPVGDLFPLGQSVLGSGAESSLRPIRAGELRSHSAKRKGSSRTEGGKMLECSGRQISVVSQQLGLLVLPKPGSDLEVQNFWPGPSAENCRGNCCIKFGGCCRGFSWRIYLGTFPTEMRRKNPATKSATKSGSSKIKIRETSVLPKTDPKNLV